MGVEQRVIIPPGAALPWSALAGRLAAHGFAVQLRMIDGLPAFPDEEPTDDWRELRVGTPAGMVTLRRGDPAAPGTPAAVAVVVWGNAGPELQRAANALLWASAAVAGGRVETPSGPVPADQFAQTADLPWPEGGPAG
jgi:hypothetical protein